MSDRLKVRRALISMSNKSALAAAAQRLADLGVELVSTGGTRAAIVAAGLPVRDVAELTGFPEMLDGRVKTLHPAVHGGLLAKRDDATHQAAMTAHGIAEIDLLAVNLYPFEETRASGADRETCVENIDIGGPAMIRAAAKNHAFVAVCADADSLSEVLDALETEDGTTSLSLRRRLAARAFARTAAYDAAVAGWMAELEGEVAGPFAAFGGARLTSLRYGENPHQSAALYASGPPRPGVAAARLAQGKPLSFNNLNDADAAFELAAEFPEDDGPCVAIVKHANPCGVSQAGTVADAYLAARACDPVSAFGGVIAANRPLDATAARAITEIFAEVVIAPDADDEALAAFAAKPNVRVLLTGALPDPSQPAMTARTIAGGLLVQDRDRGRIAAQDLRIVTKRAPTDAEIADMLFAWRVAKHVKSNAIVYAKDGATAGIGAGQMSRVDAARIAARKAQDAAEANGWPAPRTRGSACASDAFFPFADGLLQAAEAGATAVIQPGGSVRDEEVIAAADESGLAMAFTGMRHFRH